MLDVRSLGALVPQASSGAGGKDVGVQERQKFRALLLHTLPTLLPSCGGRSFRRGRTRRGALPAGESPAAWKGAADLPDLRPALSSGTQGGGFGRTLRVSIRFLPYLPKSGPRIPPWTPPQATRSPGGLTRGLPRWRGTGSTAPEKMPTPELSTQGPFVPPDLWALLLVIAARPSTSKATSIPLWAPPPLPAPESARSLTGGLGKSGLILWPRPHVACENRFRFLGVTRSLGRSRTTGQDKGGCGIVPTLAVIRKETQVKKSPLGSTGCLELAFPGAGSGAPEEAGGSR
ncbi:uncharacterized protein LOC125118781 [Phacochoerus africanus]|uniref:uncharacterized protein LOC125118781 n=1 Tax=Phacochoerus africanus TaxID=41426 RepID=UPI001FD9D612|nr:uncharacterized protein LOC125118781 [Phacochoerus africanus]